MDTSKEYIKMVDCTEIQGCVFGEEGDVVVVRLELHGYNARQDYSKGEVCIVGNDGEYDVTYPSTSDFIWLPRQDQLQEMLSGNWELRSFPYTELGGFHRFELLIYADGVIFAEGDSIEQVLLKGVMKERHGKVWRNNQWGVLSESGTNRGVGSEG